MKLSEFKISHTLLLLLPAVVTACVDDSTDTPDDNIAVAFTHEWPEGVTASLVSNATVTMTELNSGVRYSLDPMSAEIGTVPVGVYDFEATATLPATGNSENGTPAKKLRASGSSVSIQSPVQLKLSWFYESAAESLLFSEIYATGSPNATATGGLRDTYICIYNNSDHTVYADGLGIAESAFVNARASTFEILTPANNPELNFTAGTIWVIPGNGTDYPVEPGKSIKIVDQAIDWSAQVDGAIDHTDADFEWYDDHAQDTDNPSVANLEKWYCYSNTIWVISNQCNRSYVLVRFPEGTSAESYLADYAGGYDYIHTTGAQMHNDKAYLIPNKWILDGVNLGNNETYVTGALGKAVDISFASISDYNKDPNRFGKLFRRKNATVRADGTAILMDSNDSAEDFSLLKR